MADGGSDEEGISGGDITLGCNDPWRSLFELGLEPEREADGTPFADYVVFEEVGRGGTGVVYRARRRGQSACLALKLMKGADLATPQEVAHFRVGAQAAAALSHPNIVQVHDVEEHGGRIFFAMDLVTGGTLAQALLAFQSAPLRAAALLAKVARAVQHAHDHALLHRDLKPENILLRETPSDDFTLAEPLVADFGLAKYCEPGQSYSDSGSLRGTIDYMAPEQARGDSLTVRADIYSLGVVLYELCTGRRPHQGRTALDVFQQLVSEEPAESPREHVPELSRDLEAICLKCLEKAAENRYVSAGDLAEDLECAAANRPLLHARQVSGVERALRLMRRNPGGAMATLGLLAVTALLLFTAFGTYARLCDARRDASATDTAIASGHAGAMLFEFSQRARQAELAAEQPLIRALFKRERPWAPAPVMHDLLPGFRGVLLVSPEARPVAHWPGRPPEYFQRHYDFRDYYQGAKKLAEHHAHGVHLARAFRSEDHGGFGFAFSSPVYDEDGTWLGVLVALVDASSAFERIPTSVSERSRAALLGPRDHERANRDQPLPRGLSYVVHPLLSKDREVALPQEQALPIRHALGPIAEPGDQFLMRYGVSFQLADYRDPVAARDEHWLATFAPVGNTGYVFLLQSPMGEALGPTLWHEPLLRATALLLLVALLANVLWRRRAAVPR